VAPSNQRISLLAIIVDDVPAAVAFYRAALGWEPADVMDDNAFYRFNGFVLSIMHRRVWDAEDTGVPAPSYSMFAINFAERQEADAAAAALAAAGGRLIRPLQDTYWGGYSGYVQDPWGTMIELAVNPGWPITEDGRTVIPEG